MRVSIWQQFSSNHSASFTVVGKFKSAARAEEVAEELRHIIRTIGKYWEPCFLHENIREDSDRYEAAYEALADNQQPTPNEIEIYRQYDVEWSSNFYTRKYCPVDWIFGEVSVNLLVSTWEDLVILDGGNDSSVGPYPFDQIMEKLGGEVAADVGEVPQTDGYYLGVTLTCIAPNDEIADQIMNEVTFYKPRPTIILMKVPNIRLALGRLLRDDRQLTFENVQLLHQDEQENDDMPEFLYPFLIPLDYVKQHECTEIDYHFSMVSFDEMKESNRKFFDL